MASHRVSHPMMGVAMGLPYEHPEIPIWHDENSLRFNGFPMLSPEKPLLTGAAEEFLEWQGFPGNGSVFSPEPIATRKNFYFAFGER